MLITMETRGSRGKPSSSHQLSDVHTEDSKDTTYENSLAFFSFFLFRLEHFSRQQDEHRLRLQRGACQGTRTDKLDSRAPPPFFSLRQRAKEDKEAFPPTAAETTTTATGGGKKGCENEKQLKQNEKKKGRKKVCGDAFTMIPTSYTNVATLVPNVQSQKHK